MEASHEPGDTLQPFFSVSGSELVNSSSPHAAHIAFSDCLEYNFFLCAECKEMKPLRLNTVEKTVHRE